MPATLFPLRWPGRTGTRSPGRTAPGHSPPPRLRERQLPKHRRPRRRLRCAGPNTAAIGDTTRDRPPPSDGSADRLGDPRAEQWPRRRPRTAHRRRPPLMRALTGCVWRHWSVGLAAMPAKRLALQRGARRWLLRLPAQLRRRVQHQDDVLRGHLRCDLRDSAHMLRRGRPHAMPHNQRLHRRIDREANTDEVPLAAARGPLHAVSAALWQQARDCYDRDTDLDLAAESCDACPMKRHKLRLTPPTLTTKPVCRARTSTTLHSNHQRTCPFTCPAKLLPTSTLHRMRPDCGAMAIDEQRPDV